MESIVVRAENRSERLFRERFPSPKINEVFVPPKSEKSDLFSDQPERTSLSSTEDLTKLIPLTDKKVCQCLEARYVTDNICSKAGMTLIVLNPFKVIPGMYGQKQVKRYHEGDFKDLPPHVFAVSESAYSAMKSGLGTADQSIIVSGESGAGKTWTTRCLMKYLTSLASCNPAGFSPSPVHCIEKRIFDSNPILEAFGNATTQRNHNSSRFGKYISLEFNRSGFITGASIKTYLLEKTRVVHHSPKEKTFHIFYQMLEAATDEERAIWGLPLSENIQGEQNQLLLPRADTSSTHSSLRETREAMKGVGINKKQEENIFKILASILHLRNVSFCEEEDFEDACDVEDSASVQESLHMGCSLLGIDKEQFRKYLLLRRIAAHHGKRKSVFMKPCQKAEAFNRRDCVSKLLYTRLFDWLVSFLNKHTTAKDSYSSIGLLDIYGFESFSFNSLEQLCINYANEKLQQHFVFHFLKSEQDEYAKEELEWDFCHFDNNEACLDAIEGKISIFSLLNEECKLNRSSNPSALRDRILSGVSNSFVFARSKASKQTLVFVVKHFAGEVEYAMDRLTEKNKDYIPPELVEMLASSKNLFVRTLIREDILAQKSIRTNGKVAVKTVISKFKNSLDDLLLTLRKTTPRYIRCIKPNEQCNPGVFDESFVCSQLNACGVMATLAISRAGYPYKILNREFLKRYQLILPKLNLTAGEYCQKILESTFGSDQKENQSPGQKSPFKLGRSKVFLSDESLDELEGKRDKALTVLVSRIQRSWRRFRQRASEKQRHRAAVTIQAVVRGWMARLRIQKMNEAARIIQHAMLLYCIRREQERLDADLETELSETGSNDQVACNFKTEHIERLCPLTSLIKLRYPGHLSIFPSVISRGEGLVSLPKINLEDEIDEDCHDGTSGNDLSIDEEKDVGIHPSSPDSDEEEEDSIDEGMESNISGEMEEEDHDISCEGMNVTEEEARDEQEPLLSKFEFIKSTTELALGAVMVGLLLRGPLKI